MKHNISIQKLFNFVHISIFLLLFLVVHYTYGELKHTFFQQDEWMSLGLVKAHGIFGVIPNYSLFAILSGNQRVLGSILNNAFHYFFPLSIEPFVYFSIFFHSLNSFIVYLIVYKLLKNRFAATAGALYFATATVANQAVIWIAANTTVLPNAFLVLVSLYLYIEYLQSGKRLHLYISLILGILSYLFKETSAFIFVLYPILSIMLTRTKKSINKLMSEYWLIAIFLLFIIITRIFGLSGFDNAASVSVMQGANTPIRIVVHALMYPLTGLSQLFVPSQILFPLASMYQKIAYDFMNGAQFRDAVVYIIVSDILSVLVSGFIIFTMSLLYILQKNYRKVICISILFALFSFLPFIVLDRPASSYFGSRYYYLGTIGGAIIIAILIDFIRSTIHQYSKGIVSFLLATSLILGLSFFIYKNALYTRRDISSFVIQSQERINFLHALNLAKNSFPDKPILYIEGDSPGYYGVGNLSVPFQQGMGYTLMVWYFDTGKIPKELLAKPYLWNINAQGYEEVGDKAFGYYWNVDELKKLFAANAELHENQIVAFRYISSDKKLIDITALLRSQIQ